MTHLEWLFFWKLGTVVDGCLDLTYDGWFKAEIPGPNAINAKPRLSVIPDLAGERAQFPVVNDVLLALGNRELAANKKKKNLRSVRLLVHREENLPLILACLVQIVAILDDLWGSGTRLIKQLRLLKLFPTTFGREGDYGFWTRTKILLKHVKGRVDVTFHFTDKMIMDCPYSLTQITYDVEVSYGENVT